MFSAEFITFGLVCSAIGALVGYFVNNRLAIGRDRRCEWNKLIDDVRPGFILETKCTGNVRGPDDMTLLRIRERLFPWQRPGFDNAIKAYKQSKGESNRVSDGMGGFHIIDKAIIAHAAKDLLKYLKPK